MVKADSWDAARLHVGAFFFGSAATASLTLNIYGLFTYRNPDMY
jgi:hypothetical protein